MAFWGIEINDHNVGDCFTVAEVKNMYDMTRGCSGLDDDTVVGISAVEYFDGEGYMAHCFPATLDARGNVVLDDFEACVAGEEDSMKNLEKIAEEIESRRGKEVCVEWPFGKLEEKEMDCE